MACALAACGQAEPGKNHGSDNAARASKDSSTKTKTKTKTKPYAFTLPKGLTAPPEVPKDNPMSAEKIALGHKLFMEPKLSVDASRSCYSCHQNERGNADGRTKALGAKAKPLSRNTPTIWNVAYHKTLYWDGRAPSLEKQALGAWKGGNMGVGADGLDAKAAQIGEMPAYASAFKSVFGLASGSDTKPIHIARAISAYERTLLCGDTAYDNDTLSDSAERGHALFMGKARCATCHVGPNFSDGLFHNIGIEVDGKGKIRSKADLGHGKVVQDDTKNHSFRTPTLRNVAKTAPYFHDGSVLSLADAVRFMAQGGNAKAPGIAPGLQDTKIDDAGIGDLVAFLEALGCPGELKVVGHQPTLPLK